MTPHSTLLRSVERLHERGYEQVRVHPYVYALGTWRLELTIGGRLLEPPADPFFRYTSANEWNFFGDFDQPTSIERLSTRLERRLSDEKAARSPSPAYRFWYSALLHRCGAHAVPYFFREYEDCLRLGYVGIMNDGDADGIDGRFPLPPESSNRT